MNIYSLFFSFSTLVLLGGCLTVPQTPQDRSKSLATSAMDAYRANDCSRGNSQIEYLINDKVNTDISAASIKSIFDATKNAEKCYVDSIKQDIDAMPSYGFSVVLSTGNKIDYLSKYALISNISLAELKDYHKKIVLQNLFNGSLRVTYSDGVGAFGFLNSEEAAAKVASNTIDKFIDAKNSYKPDIEDLTRYIKSLPNNNPVYLKFINSLTKIKFQLRDLQYIEPIAPEFSKLTRDSLSVKLFLTVKGSDRIESSDLHAKFKADLKGIDWQDVELSAPFKVIVEKIKYDERIRQENTETITYAQHEVDTMNAVMFMPRNASYIFDRVVGGGEVEYGYAIDFYKNGIKISEELVRGKESYNIIRCQNKRIQNVFGGVSSAGFDANDDMRRKCNSSSTGSSNEIREKVISILVNKVSSIPDIERVQKLN